MAKGGFRGGYGGGFAGGGMSQANMMKQAQKMQQEMLRMQEELESREFSAAAGGGTVKAVVSGQKELVRVEIDPEAVDPEEVEMLQSTRLFAQPRRLRPTTWPSSPAA